jgi:hypothetical protein
LELQVSIEGCLISQLIDEELDFIKDSDVVLLVLNLEVAVGASPVTHVNHVDFVNKLGELSVGGRASPRAIMKRTTLHNTVILGENAVET